MAEIQHIRNLPSPEQRFSAKIEPLVGCLVWTGQRDAGGYGQFWDGNRLVGAHRYAWEYEYGPIPDDLELDHKCHNPACCKLAHLRIATRKQNQENTRIRSDNTSGYRGVSWDSRSSRWRVQVRHYGRKHFAGYFADILEADKAARALRNELFTFNDQDREGGN